MKFCLLFSLCILTYPTSIYTLTLNEYSIFLDPKNIRLPLRWNGSSPFIIQNINQQNYDLYVKINKNIIPLIRELKKDQDLHPYCCFHLDTPKKLDLKDHVTLIIKNRNKKWLSNTSKIRLSIHNSPPKLNIIAHSDSITHGGAGFLVVQSELSHHLKLLAFVDAENVPFYPKLFKRDGYYAILFPWDVNHSQEWKTQYLIAIDTAGNYTKIMLHNIIAKKQQYKKTTVILATDYVKNKVQELHLSLKDVEKIHGNIDTINAAFEKITEFDLFQNTRTTFRKSIQEIVSAPQIFSLLSTVSKPMKDAMVTASYGDQRIYTYQNKIFKKSIHTGIDFASYKNVPLYALLDGTVVHADWCDTYGQSVILYHGLGLYSLYGHASKICVRPHSQVKSGDIIAISGTTGQSTGDHLHLSILIQGIFTNPQEWLKEKSIQQLILPLKKANTVIN